MVPDIKKILFTTDLSKQTRHAFDYAISLAVTTASLTILYVMEDLLAHPRAPTCTGSSAMNAGRICANPTSRRYGKS